MIFSYLFPSHFFWWFLGLNLGVWDCKNKDLAREVLQKSTFAEIGFLIIPGSIFHDFGWPWDQFSWLLLPWRPARKLMNFHRDFGVIPGRGDMVVLGRCVPFWGTVNSPWDTRNSPWDMRYETWDMRNERLTLQSIQNVKIRKSQGCNMNPLQTEVKYWGSSKCFAAWRPLYRGAGGLETISNW